MAKLDEVILKRPKGAFFLIGAAVAGVMYFSQPTEDYAKIIGDLKVELGKAQEKYQLTMEHTQNKAKFQEDIERVSQTFRSALDYLPKQLDTQDLLKKIYSEARSAGVELAHFKPKDSVAKDFYDELPMEIELKGSYAQLLTFLANISRIPRIINIRNVEMGSPRFIDGLPQMKLTGTLIGYRYKESK